MRNLKKRRREFERDATEAKKSPDEIIGGGDNRYKWAWCVCGCVRMLSTSCLFRTIANTFWCGWMQHYPGYGVQQLACPKFRNDISTCRESRRQRTGKGGGGYSRSVHRPRIPTKTGRRTPGLRQTRLERGGRGGGRRG